MDAERTRAVPRTLELGISAGAQGREGEPLRVPFSVLTGQVLVTGDADEVARSVTRLLGQLDAAGIPWLRIGRAAAAARPPAAAVIDLTDPYGSPVTIDPFLPEPGYPEITHADRLSALLDAVFGQPRAYGDVLALALRAIYAARVPREPAPATSQIEHVVLAAARELGYPKAAREALSGFVRTRLGDLRGPATGMLLGGGQPVGMAELVRRDVDLVTADIGDAEGRAFLVGAVALRIAEHASRFPRAAGGPPRHVLVIEEGPARGSRAARHLARLLGDAGAHGTGAIVTDCAPVPAASWLAGDFALTLTHGPGTAVAAGPALGAAVTLRVPPAPVPFPAAVPWFWPVAPPAPPRPLPPAGLASDPVSGCARCRRAQQSCTRSGIAAGLALADGSGQRSAWLRLWTRTLLLAFLTGYPLPAVPPPLRAAGGVRQPHAIQCALAVLAERGVAERAAAIRDCFPAASLARALTGAAADMLAERRAPAAAGKAWVIPHLRWAREAIRVGWACVPSRPGALPRGTVSPGDLAPPLDFAISGLPDWTGILARERLRALLRHPLSLEVAANRGVAAAALFGEGGQEAFGAALAADLAVVGDPVRDAGAVPENSRSSFSPASSFSQASGLLDCDGDWLVTVMRWAPSG